MISHKAIFIIISVKSTFSTNQEVNIEGSEQFYD